MSFRDKDEREIIMEKLKTKTIPCLIMLIGGVTTLAITYFRNYSSKETLKVLLISLLACYFVGTLVKTALDRIELPIPEEPAEDLGEEGEIDDDFYEEDEDNAYENVRDEEIQPDKDDLGGYEDSMDGYEEFASDNDLHDMQTDMGEEYFMDDSKAAHEENM